MNSMQITPEPPQPDSDSAKALRGDLLAGKFDWSRVAVKAEQPNSQSADSGSASAQTLPPALTAHTPAPWSVNLMTLDGKVESWHITGTQRGSLEAIALAGPNHWRSVDECAGNAALIVRAVNNHDALVAALEEIADGCMNLRPGHVDYHKNRTKEQIEAIARSALAACEAVTGAVPSNKKEVLSSSSQSTQGDA